MIASLSGASPAGAASQQPADEPDLEANTDEENDEEIQYEDDGSDEQNRDMAGEHQADTPTVEGTTSAGVLRTKRSYLSAATTQDTCAAAATAKTRDASWDWILKIESG